MRLSPIQCIHHNPLEVSFRQIACQTSQRVIGLQVYCTFALVFATEIAWDHWAGDSKRLTVVAAALYHRCLQVRLENSPIETRTEA